jgi:hypothetical protein
VEGPFGHEIREQIDKYFTSLGKEAGPDVLVVRGYDATTFLNTFIDSAALYATRPGESYGPDDWKNVEKPALVVADALPSAFEKRGGLDKARVMIFPLAEMYNKHKDISLFFEKLLAALHSSEASNALQKLDKHKIEKYWGWITDYTEMKPGFFGFKADLGKIIGDLLGKSR